MVLRLKDATQQQRSEIARFAQERLIDIPYSIFAGLSKSTGPISNTHCSHIVWYAFKQFGYDLDYNKGMVVTPKDIAKSPYLEVVQIFGVEP